VLVSTAGEPTLSLLYVKEIMTSADHWIMTDASYTWSKQSIFNGVHI
jgi:hypothetical protein